MLSKVKYKFVLLTFGMVCVLALISSCSSTKFITEDNCLLKVAQLIVRTSLSIQNHSNHITRNVQTLNGFL